MSDFSGATTRSHVGPPPQGTIRLVILSGNVSAVRELRPGKTLSLGRAKECSLPLADLALSRLHLQVAAGPPPTVEDLGSQNGTRIGGRRLEPRQPTPIFPGTVIEAGDTFVIVQMDGASAVSEVPGTQDLDRMIGVFAKSELSIILIGETGVGKEVIAERIHSQSPRARGALVRVNCASLQEQLLESELFGHERGAFTGAVSTKQGLLERAAGGSVFLDELGEMPLTIQAKLLRAIESREVLRVGGLDPRPIDVRFIAATNRDLQEQIRVGTFRRDLYFRLDGITLHVPPLRNRINEIESLARRFIAEESGRSGDTTSIVLPGGVLTRLRNHSWPGNIRELRNVIRRAMVLAGGGPLSVEHLLFEPSARGSIPPGEGFATSPLESAVEDFERARILAALEANGGNQTRTAEALGISRRTLVARLSSYGLTKPRAK